jgi:HK97 family phage portal protein
MPEWLDKVRRAVAGPTLTYDGGGPASGRKGRTLPAPGGAASSWLAGWSDSTPSGAWRPTGGFDYARAVGDGSGSSIVVACLSAIATAVAEPPLRLFRQPAGGGDPERVPGAPLEALLRRPNPFMTWEQLAAYVATAQHVWGAAYLWKARAASGRVVELWPLPPDRVGPAWPAEATTLTWITHFAYRAGHLPGGALALPTADVVYLPLALDPRDLRRPRSPLRSVLAHIFTDEECTSFLAALLRNYGVPPVILTPDPAAGGSPSQEEADRLKTGMTQRFGGEGRGQFMVTAAPFKVTLVGQTPQQMQVDRLQMLPEARVCAVLGVPAIVAGLWSGQLRATYSNSRQLREHFVESKMVPYWRQLEAGLSAALVPDFYGPVAGASGDVFLRFDLQDVRALAEDQNAKSARVTELLKAGGLTINEARQELGYPELTGGDGNVLLVPNTLTPTAPADLLAEPEPEPGPAALPGAGALPAVLAEAEATASAARRNGRAH